MYARPPYNKELTARAREMRKKSTPSEIALWNQLKRRKIKGFQFYRQFPIHNYIVDFYCKKLKLAIEVDGSSHHKKESEDVFRQGELESFGISLLRFQVEEIEQNLASVIARIKTSAEKFPP